MLKTLIKSKSNIVITLAAAVVIITMTGGLGLGDFLNNRLAFGYGGGGGLGYIVTPLVSVNRPLVISDIKKAGRLFRNLDKALIEVEVPPLSVDGYSIFDVKQMAVGADANVCEGSGKIIGNTAFTIFGKDVNDQPITKFNNHISVSVTMAGLPVNSSTLGVYYLNSNQQWVFGGQAIFNVQNSKVTFRTDETGTFAIINTVDLPRLIESQARCKGKVLGAVDYAEGAILRTCDAQMYQIHSGRAWSIGRLPLVNQSFKGAPVFDVDFNLIVRYTPEGHGPARYKSFAQGDLLRTCDWKIFRIEGDKFTYITTLTILRDNYEGQKINNVDYWQIAKYQGLTYNPTDTSVLGAKRFAPGALIRTDDNKVYVVEPFGVRHLVTLSRDVNFFAGQQIFNVSDATLEFHKKFLAEDTTQQVLGAKAYGDGALLRTRDWNVFRLENGQLKKVAVLAGANVNTFQGQAIINVDYADLAQYTMFGETLLDNPTQQVLGVKQYANGTLLKTPDGKIYVMQNNKPIYVPNATELQKYAGNSTINITQAQLTELQTEVTTGGKVLGTKIYADGTLLKTPDWKVYEVLGNTVHHVATYPGTSDYYQGKKVISVTYDALAQFELAK